jgi:hypothetical protein
MVASARSQEPASPTTALSQLSSSRLLSDVRALSGPEFRGRLTGTPSDRRSAAFVADRFAALGLQPAGDAVTSWKMSTTVKTAHIDEGSRLRVVGLNDEWTARLPLDYLPVLDSPTVDVNALIIFVGYGISDPSHGWDEYAGLDVRGKVVLFLRGQPTRDGARVTQQDKIRYARMNGASAFLMCTGPVLTSYEARRGTTTTPLAFYNQVEPAESLPGAWLSTESCERIMGDTPAKGREALRDAQEQLNRMVIQSRATPFRVDVRWQSQAGDGELHNVLGLIPGADPDLRSEYVVFGAHRDHFGEQAGIVFPGADDNASGTAILLETARIMAESKTKPKRSVLFISFSGEEQGLWGSRLYLARPARPLNRTVAMINVDHAGIGNGRLTVGITGLPNELAAQVARHAELGERVDVYGFFPGGDHVPFKEAGIPTITVVSGGPHPYVHTPADTADSIQPDVLTAAARYVLALVWNLANREA